MTRPPLAERLILGFVTDPALGEAILGDLTEEWRTRTIRDGRKSADLWYWGQAIRTMPHLLREWCVTATVGTYSVGSRACWASSGSQRCLRLQPM